MMDFSEFGQPTKEWLNFVATNPSAARDGFSGNDPAQAGFLRKESNKARSTVSERLLAESGLDTRVKRSTVQLPSRGSHTIPLRLYEPQALKPEEVVGAVLYFHGGGYLLGDETSDDFLCCRIAGETKTVVLSVIYRHTHKYKHPAQVDDALDAFSYLRKNDTAVHPILQLGRLVVMGISAGCTLAANVVLEDVRLSRSHPGYKARVTGALLGIPWLIHIDNYPFGLFESREVTAKVQNEEAPVIPYERLQLFSKLLGCEDPADERLNIALLSPQELGDWPRTAFLVAGADPLRDDGLLLVTKLESMDVPTKVHVYPGLPHGFRRWNQLNATHAFDGAILDSIGWALGHNSPQLDRGGHWDVYNPDR
ncbi:hypothetical protein VTL71DRAFT_1623 [Oculimacula yallundae]|uniref:Alpha/beta hydrolase fold-3 domain-containing protein n=1 Tax=Oculimacula yallundae TaxID=86028 RepID=A0ABR4CBC0_9HELO